MRQIHVEPLTKEAYAPFGQYYALNAPEGYPLQGELHRFYPDRLIASAAKNTGYSPIFVKKPEKMVVSAIEYHTTTCEMLLSLNDDFVLHVAPPSAGKPVPELTKAFLVPKFTLIKMNAAVWHLCPLPAHAAELSALVILPECTYMNDCTVVELKPEEQFEIVL